MLALVNPLYRRTCCSSTGHAFTVGRSSWRRPLFSTIHKLPKVRSESNAGSRPPYGIAGVIGMLRLNIEPWVSNVRTCESSVQAYTLLLDRPCFHSRQVIVDAAIVLNDPQSAISASESKGGSRAPDGIVGSSSYTT